ncbi:uncharacterized protein LOC130677592 [Microplitis mediator]|uniref:uncharacterized protein LOC130677592 n=1 Tax=Microplitis mediator TaxID=375433 RepID=UPI002554BB72|nr:uncharacterized protein LOC130677592 [Microplitis mediator]
MNQEAIDRESRARLRRSASRPKLPQAMGSGAQLLRAGSVHPRGDRSSSRDTMYMRRSRSQSSTRRSIYSGRCRSPSYNPEWQEMLKQLTTAVTMLASTQSQNLSPRPFSVEGSPNAPGHPRGLQGKKLIPLFDPKVKIQSIESRIHKVEELQEIYGWSDTTTSCYALDNLRGIAGEWYRGLPTIAITWNQWKIKLRDAFTDHTKYSDRLIAMMQRKKMRDESMMEFFFAKAVLVDACEITGHRAADCIAQGVEDNALRIAISRFEL